MGNESEGVEVHQTRCTGVRSRNKGPTRANVMRARKHAGKRTMRETITKMIGATAQSRERRHPEVDPGAERRSSKNEENATGAIA